MPVVNRGSATGDQNADTAYAAFGKVNDKFDAVDLVAGQQATAIMRELWRAGYTVDGVPGTTAWTPIGEELQVPAGAVAVSYEYSGEVIDGGPWYVVGGEPRN